MEENQNQQDKPIYIHQYPYRFVQPYPYTYKTFTKGRWVGKPLLATLIKQFKAYPPQYYQHSIEIGRITVNGKLVLPEYILKNGDEIVHVSLRVQPPVLDLPIEIVEQSQDFLVINKPPSIIVHTGGGHHYNTIQNLLKYQYKYSNLYVLHRLDKCTSGLLIFAKDKQHVAIFHEESGKQIMKKMYYARVNGNFLWQEKELSAYIQCVSHKDGVYRVTKQIEPLLMKQNQKQEENIRQIVDIHKKQKNQQKQMKVLKGNKPVDPDVKDSKTIFKKVWYDDLTDSSLLQCYPVTGRTHQIRVHLQFLGFPILNDVVYGGRFVGNKIIQNISKTQNQKEDEIENISLPKKKLKMNEQNRVEEWDYQTKSWQIMLHSYKYAFGGRQFKTKVPYWFFKQNISYKHIKE